MRNPEVEAIIERNRLKPGDHPHLDKGHIVRQNRAYILSCKRKHGSARSQVHYMGLILGYLEAKKCLIG